MFATSPSVRSKTVSPPFIPSSQKRLQMARVTELATDPSCVEDCRRVTPFPGGKTASRHPAGSLVRRPRHHDDIVMDVFDWPVLAVRRVSPSAGFDLNDVEARLLEHAPKFLFFVILVVRILVPVCVRLPAV